MLSKKAARNPGGFLVIVNHLLRSFQNKLFCVGKQVVLLMKITCFEEEIKLFSSAK